MPSSAARAREIDNKSKQMICMCVSPETSVLHQRKCCYFESAEAEVMVYGRVWGRAGEGKERGREES